MWKKSVRCRGIQVLAASSDLVGEVSREGVRRLRYEPPVRTEGKEIVRVVRKGGRRRSKSSMDRGIVANWLSLLTVRELNYCGC